MECVLFPGSFFLSKKLLPFDLSLIRMHLLDFFFFFFVFPVCRLLRQVVRFFSHFFNLGKDSSPFRRFLPR